MRVNGFQRPFHLLQFLSWVLLAVYAGSFYVFFSRILPSPWSIIADAVYSVLITLVLYSAAYCTAVDPADVTVRNLWRQNEHQEPAHAETQAPAPSEDMFYCCLCQTHVHKKSKHCRICDKCVDCFDHHCKWLNNCVGVRTYRHFFMLMVTAFLQMAVQAIIGAYLIVTYIIDWGPVARRAYDLYRMSGTCYIVLLSFFEALTGPVILLLGQLLFFHVFLVSRHMTTYEFIIAQRSKEKNPERDTKGQSFALFFSKCLLKKHWKKRRQIEPISRDNSMSQHPAVRRSKSHRSSCTRFFLPFLWGALGRKRRNQKRSVPADPDAVAADVAPGNGPAALPKAHSEILETRVSDSESDGDSGGGAAGGEGFGCVTVNKEEVDEAMVCTSTEDVVERPQADLIQVQIPSTGQVDVNGLRGRSKGSSDGWQGVSVVDRRRDSYDPLRLVRQGSFSHAKRQQDRESAAGVGSTVSASGSAPPEIVLRRPLAATQQNGIKSQDTLRTEPVARTSSFPPKSSRSNDLHPSPDQRDPKHGKGAGSPS